MKTLHSFSALLRFIDNSATSSAVHEQIQAAMTHTRASPVSLKNVVGSLKAVVVAQLWKRALSPAHLLVVCGSMDDALSLSSDLHVLMDAQRVVLYADTEQKIAHTAEQLDARLVTLTGALNTISHATERAERLVIVATAASLAYAVPAPSQMHSNMIVVERGKRLPFQEFITTLTLNGFNSKDFVEGVGDVAVRGGIVDVFPPGAPAPLRLEFFGDDVDSIREFDPLSQRSIREMDTASVVTHLFHNNDHDVSATVLEYLAPETVVVQISPEEIVAMLSKELTERGKELAEWFGERNGSHREKQSPTKQHGQRQQREHTVDAREHAVYKQLTAFTTLAINPLGEAELAFEAAAQPVFHSSVKALVKEVEHLVSKGAQVYLCADGSQQLKRFKDLVESALDDEADSETTELTDCTTTHTPRTGTTPKAERPSIEQWHSSVSLLPVALSEGFVLHAGKQYSGSNLVAVLTEHQVFMRRKSLTNAGEARATKSSKGITLKELQQLKPGDYVVHVDKGIAQFEGLEMITMGGVQQECARLVFAGGDKLYVHLHYINRLQKYSAEEGKVPTLTKLGTSEWQRKKERTKKRIKDIARDLIQLYAKRKMQPGYAFGADTLWQKEMEASFIYEDTPDQAKATAEVKFDMESETPMDRLVCGDVGFGKTEVAIRAAFKAVQAGKQVAVLVPTTILAEQHYSSFRDRLDRYAVSIEVLSRFRSAAEQKDIIKRVSEGKVDVLIGTHRMLSKDVQFRDLGLLVVDEEHRFGVAAKEKLRQMRVSVDTLTLTATPIPRTLNFSLMGARDVSVINTPPRNRLPVITEITVWDDNTLRQALERELRRGGQVFFVNDRVGDLPELAVRLQELLPDLRVSVAHGQLSAEELENTMEQFLERKTDVLLATKIIESGIDIPNANTMIINRSDNFGLAELYQLRGRVGRSNVQAYCYLLIPPPHVISRQALRRLQAIEEFTELGSGFQLAMRDLEIRGSGNLLGAEQSGFITDIGFELYQKILDEAVYELKEEEFAELFALRGGNTAQQRANGSETASNGLAAHSQEAHQLLYTSLQPASRRKSLVVNEDLTVDVEGEAMLPKTYIASDVERYEMYKKLFRANTEDGLAAITSELRDRFGALPPEAFGLLDAVRLRIAGLPTGFGHISLKGNTLTCEFPPEDHTRFYNTVFQQMIAALSTINEVRLVPKGKKVMVQAHVAGIDGAVALLRMITERTQEQIASSQPERVSSLEKK